MSNFYIINDVDRPNERMVAQVVNWPYAEYLSDDLRDWHKNYGQLKVTGNSTPIEGFGFDVSEKDGRVFFSKTRPTVATYKDGKARHWDGFPEFVLCSKKIKTSVSDKDLWINTEDEMPAPYVPVWIMCDQSKTPFIAVFKEIKGIYKFGSVDWNGHLYFEDGSWHYQRREISEVEVYATHWMPLPEPPEASA